MSYKEVFAHSKKKLPAQDLKVLGFRAVLELVHVSLSVPTLMAIGAFVQAVFMLLPLRPIYTIAPAALYILSRIAYTILINCNLLSNPYLKDVIPFKWSAIVPQQNGHFPPEDKPPTNERVAILLLSATINHPLGWLGAPHMKAFGGHFVKMRRDLAKKPQSETGFLGQTKAYIPLENGAVQILNISYWRSAAHVVKYAESPLHRDAINWWHQNQADIPHIGIMHETFESPPGLWESVYIGFQPTLLGATTYLREGDKIVAGHTDQEWIQPILDARRGKLARSRGRMGWNVQVGGHPDF